MTEDEALGRLLALAAADHPALRYAAIFGLTMIDPDVGGGEIRGAIAALEGDRSPKIALAAIAAAHRLRFDEDEPVTAVDSPDARRRSVPPTGENA